MVDEHKSPFVHAMMSLGKIGTRVNSMHNLTSPNIMMKESY